MSFMMEDQNHAGVCMRETPRGAMPEGSSFASVFLSRRSQVTVLSGVMGLITVLVGEPSGGTNFPSKRRGTERFAVTSEKR